MLWQPSLLQSMTKPWIISPLLQSMATLHQVLHVMPWQPSLLQRMTKPWIILPICLAFAGQDFVPHVLPYGMETSTPGGYGSEEPAPISETQPTGVMEGPALPRWIDDASVDSMAMYSAFLSVLNDSLKYKCRGLYIIHHRPGPSICQPFPERMWCTDLG